MSTKIGLSTKIRAIPSELPDAKIYLEDVEEIANILIDVYRKERSDYEDEPKIIYLIGNEQFDSLESLQTLGGTSTKFAITINGNISRSVQLIGMIPPEAHLSGLDDQSQWMVFGLIKSIFESRSYKFKNAVRALPTSIKISIYAAIVIGFQLINFGHGTLRATLLAALYLIVPALIVMELLHRSVVIFSPAHKVSSGWTEQRRGYIQNLLFALLGAALSVIFQAAFDHFKAKH
jgi:hypothetical protein